MNKINSSCETTDAYQLQVEAIASSSEQLYRVNLKCQQKSDMYEVFVLLKVSFGKRGGLSVCFYFSSSLFIFSTVDLQSSLHLCSCPFRRSRFKILRFPVVILITISGVVYEILILSRVSAERYRRSLQAREYMLLM